MDKCEICGRTNANLVCSQCGRNVCSDCFHAESRLCNVCINAQKIEQPPTLIRGDIVSTFGRLLPLGIGLIFAGMILMMIASILTAPGGGGIFVGIFPFFIGTVSEPVALAITVVFIIISLLVMFLPWILGPRRVLRAVKKMANLKTEDFQLRELEKKGKSEIEDYLITLKMSGLKEDDIEVRVFNNDLIVQASKNGEMFRKTYDLPSGYEPKGIGYNYEADFLIIRVSLKRKEEA